MISVAGQVLGNIDIVYKYTNDFEQVWKDTGSGGKYDGSIWRIKNNDRRFCALGDIVQKGTTSLKMLSW